jgi:CheY-like chemotaxis protein
LAGQPVSSRKKILVIDDDPSMLALLKRQLENAGYAVLLAEDGIVGGHLALNASPDLILVDVHMPYMSDYELVEALKADSATWHIPVIFLSSDKHDRRRLDRLSATAIPVSMPKHAGTSSNTAECRAALCSSPDSRTLRTRREVWSSRKTTAS